MVRLTFYGGINEIGGNKILLEDGDRKFLLDFGFPYKRYKLFYEEYLKPRSGAGLLDPLVMGLLPPLDGIYRADLQTPSFERLLRSNPLYRQLEQVDGILLSHAHLDHSGYISFLRDDITVFSTAATAFITKAMQDSGRASFDQQVCYFTPTAQDCPADWKQSACLASDKARLQRQFCIADISPDELSPEAISFWQETPGQKELISCLLGSHTSCSFNLRCFPVDHSIPGACAWGIETTSGWIVYTGDLRLHGKHAHFTEKFIEKASRLHPRALIIEGTNVPREKNISEQEVYQNGLKAIASSKSLVIADFSPRDVDRLLTFLQIARDTGRKLVILPKDAYLLKTMRLLEPEIPDIAQDDNLAIYQDTTASKYPSSWIRNICKEYNHKVLLAEDISSSQDKFILCFSFFDLDELPSLSPEPGSLYVYSSSEPYNEEQEIDFQRLHQWLKHFQLKGFGVQVKQGDKWQVPSGEEGLHASGHACGPDLLKLVQEIKPEILLPVHTEHPNFYTEHLKHSGINVILPDLAKSIEI